MNLWDAKSIVFWRKYMVLQWFPVVKAELHFLKNLKSHCWSVRNTLKTHTKTEKSVKCNFFNSFWQTSKDEPVSKKWKQWILCYFGDISTCSILFLGPLPPFTNLAYSGGGSLNFSIWSKSTLFSCFEALF